MQMRQERAEQEREQNAVLAEHWRQRNIEVEQEEREEKQAALLKAREIRRSQESQIQEMRRKRQEERAAQLLASLRRESPSFTVVCLTMHSAMMV